MTHEDRLRFALRELEGDLEDEMTMLQQLHDELQGQTSQIKTQYVHRKEGISWAQEHISSRINRYFPQLWEKKE